MHLCCFQWFLPLFLQFSRCEILGTLQAFSPVFRLIKRIRTVCVSEWGGGGVACVYAAKSFQGLWNETLQRPFFFPIHAFLFPFFTQPLYSVPL